MRNKLITILLVLLAAATAGEGVKIADLSSLQGQRTNRLMTVGLVAGLGGTGDGGKFIPAILPLANFVQHFTRAELSVDEFKSAKNVALVTVEAQVGPNGAREGESLDVTVSAIGSAKSLKGGRLLLIPLMGPHKSDPTIYALAGGPVDIPDPTVPTTGVVKNGAVMEQDVVNSFIQNDSFTLVIDDAHAGWPMASTVAEAINEAVSIRHADRKIAWAKDPKNILVTIPAAELKDPAHFIAWIQGLPLLMPEKTAQVTINARTGTIVTDENVTISPVTISYKGITLSTEMLVKQLRQQAQEKQQPFEAPEYVNVSLLIDAMNYLALPVEDRIAILRELARTGNLQGQLVEQP